METYRETRSKSVRTTIMLPADIERKLRIIQADLILRNSKAVGLSTVVKMLLDEAMDIREKKYELEEKTPQYSF